MSEIEKGKRIPQKRFALALRTAGGGGIFTAYHLFGTVPEKLRRDM